MGTLFIQLTQTTLAKRVGNKKPIDFVWKTR
jgi:hypothetical protein